VETAFSLLGFFSRLDSFLIGCSRPACLQMTACFVEIFIPHSPLPPPSILYAN
jgi:hypothetical protein